MKKDKKNMQSKMNKNSKACDNKRINARTKNNNVTDKSIGFDDENRSE